MRSRRIQCPEKHHQTLRHSLSEMRILYETRRSQSPKNMSRHDTQLTKIERADSTAANYANLPRRALTPSNVSGATIPDHPTSWGSDPHRLLRRMTSSDARSPLPLTNPRAMGLTQQTLISSLKQNKKETALIISSTGTYVDTSASYGTRTLSMTISGG
ncbi:hypothetical protein DY000_02020798 [Brassica cretica]|uniref:DUF4005 domain-containing protein n=1 Tax=Brassica cretica TaxID=69181 RepID=A0ABQ7E8M9_BRACR|nr:hypothetical protein DY000_02020798 [Brassica cretica]